MQSSVKPKKEKASTVEKTPSKKQKRPSPFGNISTLPVPTLVPNQERVCVLTGASGALGTAFIKKYAVDYKIIAIHNGHDLTPLPKLVDPLNTSFPIEIPEVISMRADLSKPDEIERLCYDIIEKYGKVDVLINAACHRDWQPLLADGALDQAETSYSVNVLAPMRLAIGFARRFWLLKPPEQNTRNNRNVINISSTAGSYIYPDSGQTIYSSSKAALNFASHHMASEFWEIGVRVNSVAPNTFPGIVSTERVLDAIEYFDCSQDTGQLKLIDAAEPNANLCSNCGFHLE